MEHTKERITNSGSLCELQLSQQESSSAYHSGKSSPLPDDQISSTPESISEPVLHSSSSLTPLYEESRERLREKQTDSSDLSTEEGSASHLGTTSAGSSSRGRTFVKLRRSLMRPSPLTLSPNLSMPIQKERPTPPMRSCSYMSAITSPPQADINVSSQEDNMLTMQSAPASTVHYPSNSFQDSPVVNTSNNNDILNLATFYSRASVVSRMLFLHSFLHPVLSQYSVLLSTLLIFCLLMLNYRSHSHIFASSLISFDEIFQKFHSTSHRTRKNTKVSTGTFSATENLV